MSVLALIGGLVVIAILGYGAYHLATNIRMKGSEKKDEN